MYKAQVQIPVRFVDIAILKAECNSQNAQNMKRCQIYGVEAISPKDPPLINGLTVKGYLCL